MKNGKCIKKLNKVRKLIREKIKYSLPKSEATYSQQTIDYTEQEYENWFNSFRGKNQVEITESIFVESW